MTATDALLNSSHIELLITRVRFPDNTPNGVALGRMARIKRPGIKVLFTSFPDVHEHIDGVGEYLPRPFSQEELPPVVDVGSVASPGFLAPSQRPVCLS